MNDWNDQGRDTIAPHFDNAVKQNSPELLELVRHLARISAENDYKAFLKKTGMRYSDDRKKGPPQ